MKYQWLPSFVEAMAPYLPWIEEGKLDGYTEEEIQDLIETIKNKA